MIQLETIQTENFHSVDDEVVSVYDEVYGVLKSSGIKIDAIIPKKEIQVVEWAILLHKKVTEIKLLLKDFPVKVFGNTNTERIYIEIMG